MDNILMAPARACVAKRRVRIAGAGGLRAAVCVLLAGVAFLGGSPEAEARSFSQTQLEETRRQVNAGLRLTAPTHDQIAWPSESSRPYYGDEPTAREQAILRFMNGPTPLEYLQQTAKSFSPEAPGPQQVPHSAVRRVANLQDHASEAAVRQKVCSATAQRGIDACGFASSDRGNLYAACVAQEKAAEEQCLVDESWPENPHLKQLQAQAQARRGALTPAPWPVAAAAPVPIEPSGVRGERRTDQVIQAVQVFGAVLGGVLQAKALSGGSYSVPALGAPAPSLPALGAPPPVNTGVCVGCPRETVPSAN